MKYKRIKKVVPWCDKCKEEIFGNGSMQYPYHCDCGVYQYDKDKHDYVLNNNK